MPNFISKCNEDVENIFVEYLDEIGLNSSFQLYAWGQNGNGDLGDGSATNRSTPVHIGTCSWKYISSGYRSSFGIKADGTGMAWGNAGNGRLGNNSYTPNRCSPVAICGTGKWKTLRGGSYHAGGIKTDGTLWTWGHNGYCQLGDGTSTCKLTPVQIGTANNWKCLFGSKGGQHFIALKTDGTLWSWGRNQAGQVGDGTTINKSSPIQVGALTTWKCVTGRGNATYGWKTDGTIWHWGNVILFASCTNVCYSTPVQFSTVEDNWKQFVVSGSNHVIALKKNGTMWSWGANANGQLGHGTTIVTCSAVQIGSGCDWRFVESEYSVSYAIKTDGSLWAWGNNTSGQLGDGTTIKKSTPIQVGVWKDWYCVSTKIQTTALRLYGECSCL